MAKEAIMDNGDQTQQEVALPFHLNIRKGVSREEAERVVTCRPERLGGVVLLFGATEAEDRDLSAQGEDLEAAA